MYTHLVNNSPVLSARPNLSQTQAAVHCVYSPTVHCVFTPILLLPEGLPLSSELKALLRLQRPVVSEIKNISVFFMFFK